MNDASVLSRFRGLNSLGSWSVAALLIFVVSALQAQLSEEAKKKRDAFLKAREEMHTIASPTPSEAETPSGKPKAAKKKGKAKAKKSPTPKEEDEEEETPRAKPKKSPSPTPNKAKKAEEEPEERKTPTPSAVPRKSDAELPSIPPSQRGPAPTATFAAPPADITIQKSGIEEPQGYEPPPPPPPRRGFWQRVFGGDKTNFRYLSRNVIEAIRRAPVQRGRWKFIIVHNSGTRQGNARAFDYYHRRVRKMQNGLAYHFVVGNGTSSGDGQIEIGDRWRRQINGGHVHSDYLNNISLGICLVGDFNRSQPTRAQLGASEELIQYLRQRCGGTIPVRPHREMNPPQWATDCPGDAFPYAWFRKF